MNVTRGARVADPMTDGVLSLLWPGLGQLHQGRTGAGVYFMAESLTLVIAWFVAPTWGILLAVVFAAITIWSIKDAVAGARRVADTIDQPAS
jgi:TM2 domain-containing membrane protein YozV